jgi:hypothetical protein
MHMLAMSPLKRLCNEAKQAKSNAFAVLTEANED